MRAVQRRPLLLLQLLDLLIQLLDLLAQRLIARIPAHLLHQCPFLLHELLQLLHWLRHRRIGLGQRLTRRVLLLVRGLIVGLRGHLRHLSPFLLHELLHLLLQLPFLLLQLLDLLLQLLDLLLELLHLGILRRCLGVRLFSKRISRRTHAGSHYQGCQEHTGLVHAPSGVFSFRPTTLQYFCFLDNTTPVSSPGYRLPFSCTVPWLGYNTVYTPSTEEVPP